MQKTLRFFTLTLAVFAIIGLLGTVVAPQSAMAACPRFITNCGQCDCVGDSNITPFDLLGALKCIIRYSSYRCSQYEVTGDNRVTFSDFRVLLNCYVCQQRQSPTA